MKKIMFSDQAAFLRNHGDAIFDELCDNVPEEPFRIYFAATRIPYLRRFAPSLRQKYLRLVLRNVEVSPSPAVWRYGPGSQFWHWKKSEGA